MGGWSLTLTPECGLWSRPLHSSSCLVLPTHRRREATIKFGPDKSRSYKLKMNYYPTTLTVRFASLQINSVRLVTFSVPATGLVISCTTQIISTFRQGGARVLTAHPKWVCLARPI